MPTQTQKRSIWINGFEILLFLTLLSWVIYSGTRLVSQWDQFETALAEGAKGAGLREIASLRVTPLETIETQCDALSDQTTSANKIRLSGPICGLGLGSRWVRTEVMNDGTNAKATVFGSATEGRFSTDYLSLIDGKNQISVRFIFDGRDPLEQRFTVIKNGPHSSDESAAPQTR